MFLLHCLNYGSENQQNRLYQQFCMKNASELVRMRAFLEKILLLKRQDLLKDFQVLLITLKFRDPQKRDLLHYQFSQGNYIFSKSNQEVAKPENQTLTKMTIQNISLVFAPNFLRCPIDDPFTILQLTKFEQRFMTTLIAGRD